MNRSSRRRITRGDSQLWSTVAKAAESQGSLGSFGSRDPSPQIELSIYTENMLILLQSITAKEEAGDGEEEVVLISQETRATLNLSSSRQHFQPTTLCMNFMSLLSHLQTISSELMMPCQPHVAPLGQPRLRFN